jgi:hypothetical protein
LFYGFGLDNSWFESRGYWAISDTKFSHLFFAGGLNCCADLLGTKVFV